jgi:membrane-bound lytic murein transglycosylase D
VIPTDLLEDAAALRLLAAHEMQHHRQRDLQVLEAMELLRAAFFWNPAVAAWTRVVEELQELACDAAVVGDRRADVRVYGELLLRAARLEGRERFVPRGASAAGGGSSRVLKRRIAMMMTRGEGRERGGLVAGVVCVALLTGAALGARSAVLEKKLETRDVAVLAEKVGARGLVVAVNDVVLGEVNRWLATSKDRVFLRESRQRLEERRAMVEAAFARHRVPSALAAVAVVESGFRPLEQKTGFRAAGVWQFIPDTARVFGLKVDAETDERLNLEKETDAAARYLAALHQQLGDWPLALAGYSEGGRKVATVVQEAQTRDAWELIRTGKLGRYPATVVAAALVLEDARLLEGAAD